VNKSFRFRFKNRWSELFVAASFRHKVLNIKKHAWKSLSQRTVGQAAGWKMNEKFSYRQTRSGIWLCW